MESDVDEKMFPEGARASYDELEVLLNDRRDAVYAPAIFPFHKTSDVRFSSARKNASIKSSTLNRAKHSTRSIKVLIIDGRRG